MKINVFILPFLLSCIASAADPNALEQTLRDLDAQWSRAAGAKDLGKTVSFYANDAVVLPPNEPLITSRDGIRNLWKGFLDGISDMSWKTIRVEIAKSGDMAVLTGTYEISMKNGTKDRGKYCEVWEKETDGHWRCGTDMFSSDLPAGPATSAPPGAVEKK